MNLNIKNKLVLLQPNHTSAKNAYPIRISSDAGIMQHIFINDFARI